MKLLLQPKPLMGRLLCSSAIGQIGLIGYFGWGNFGDEVFLNQWRDVLGTGCTFRVNDLLQKPYISRPADAVAADAEAFVIGGGDLIRTEAVSSLYWNRAWTEKPLVISGVGVAQESGRNRSDVIPRLKSFVARAQILSFSARDPASQRWIRENLNPLVEVKLVPDLAYAALHQRPSRRQRSLRTVGLVLNKLVTTYDLNVLASLLEAEAAGALKVRLLVLATGIQRETEIAQLKVHRLEGRAEVFSTIAEMVQAIGQVDILYSAKFHGLVAASAQGVPSRSLRDTSKAKNLSLRLGMPQMMSMTIPKSLPVAADVCTESSVLAHYGKNFGELARAELADVKAALQTLPKSNY